MHSISNEVGKLQTLGEGGEVMYSIKIDFNVQDGKTVFFVHVDDVILKLETDNIVEKNFAVLNLTSALAILILAKAMGYKVTKDNVDKLFDIFGEVRKFVEQYTGTGMNVSLA